jgi:hypothetical protein
MEFKTPMDRIEYKAFRYTFKGKTQCAALVQQVTGAPGTSLWRPGKRVKDALPGEIPVGTAIATFDADGKYPTTDPPGRHAAIYLAHDKNSIVVIDQWDGQDTPAARPIRYKGADQLSDWQNNGDMFYVVVADTALAIPPAPASSTRPLGCSLKQ